ncbi:MAG: FAD-binding oxidoreductase [Spirochaetes bacterium]|nr:FAD-binding oxidoreductase [Spirochaetota bacterium]
MNGKMTDLMNIVKEAEIIDDPAVIESFAHGYRGDVPMRPMFMVKPKNTDEVQKIVRWANETCTPLVPVSSGAPHLRGGTVPTAPGSVIVDLSGMDRIVKVDRRNRLALIEPGVTYTTLGPELKRHGLRIAMPLLPRKNKSVLTSLLEREPVVSPRYQWNMMEPLRALEIIWGNGDKFYSGGGVFRGEKEEDWKRGLVPVWGPGPGQLDFYKFVSAAQGSMGIVTWASVKCEVYPECRKLFFVPADRLEEAIEFVYLLLRYRFGDELFLMNKSCLAYVHARNADELESVKDTLPSWAVVVGITGGHILSKDRVEAREKDIRDIARGFGLKFIPQLRSLSGKEFGERIMRPCEEPYWKSRYSGEVQEVFFLTTLDRTPGFVAAMNEEADGLEYPAERIGVYLQPVHQGVGCHCEFIIPFDPDSRMDTRKTEELIRKSSLRLSDQGAFFSRPYGIWADMVYDRDAGTKTATKKIKEIFDPNNVMNPGKLCF